MPVFWYNNGTLPIVADTYEESLSKYLTLLGIPPLPKDEQMPLKSTEAPHDD